MWAWIVVAGAVIVWLIEAANSIGFVDDFSGGSLPGGNPNMRPSLRDWADAIFHFEGGAPGNRNVRNNNPGNLRVMGAPGQVGVDGGGFAIFASFDDGMAALLADLQAKVNKYPNATLAQITARYSPASDSNNPGRYADYVAGKLGVNASDRLISIFKG